MKKKPTDITLYLSGPAEANNHKRMVWTDFVAQHWPGPTILPMMLGDRGKSTKEALTDACKEVVQENCNRILAADAVLVMWKGASVNSSVDMFYAASVGRPVYMLNESNSTVLSVYTMACVKGVASVLAKKTLEDILAQLEAMDLQGSPDAAH